MINNQINYIWFISSTVMNKFHYHQNILLYISKNIFPLLLPFFFLSDQNIERFRSLCLTFIPLSFFVCLVICLVVCVSLLLYFLLYFMMKKQKLKCFFFFFCVYHKIIAFFFHIKIKQRFFLST